MNTIPPYPQSFPPLQRQPVKRQFPPVLLGIGYMLMHIVLLYAVQIVTIVAFMVYASMKLGSDTSGNELAELTEKFIYKYSDVLSIVTQFLTVGVVILIFVIIRAVKKENKPPVIEYFSLRKVKPSVVGMSALLSFGAYFTVISIISLISVVFPEFVESYNETMESVSTDPNWVLQFITLVIGAPLCEELIYRNMSITNLNKKIAPMISVLITSAVFGLAHGQPLQIVYAGALGLVFGIIFIRTESLYPSLVAHAVFNLLGFTFSYLDEIIAPESSAENALNIVLWVLIIVSYLTMPLVFYWLVKHTKTPKKLVKAQPQQPNIPNAQTTTPQYQPYPGYLPYAPYPPQYGYPQYSNNPPYPPQSQPYYNPYPHQGPAPQQPQPYPGWVFNQYYGWIYVGTKTETTRTESTDTSESIKTSSDAIPTEEVQPPVDSDDTPTSSN